MPREPDRCVAHSGNSYNLLTVPPFLGHHSTTIVDPWLTGVADHAGTAAPLINKPEIKGAVVDFKIFIVSPAHAKQSLHYELVDHLRANIIPRRSGFFPCRDEAWGREHYVTVVPQPKTANEKSPMR